MKIYLRNLQTGEYELHEGELKQLQKELDKRSIYISYYAKIGDYAKIGNYAKIGYNAEIGYSAEIGNYAKIGYNAEIGNYAKIGYNAEIGYSAEIGDYAKILKIENFSKEHIFTQLGLLPDSKGYYTFYKATREDFTDFYSGKYQYQTSKGDKVKAERNQNIQYGDNCWHFTNLWNAIAFGRSKGNFKLISAKVHIDDILSIYDKVRVRKFSDVKEVNINL